MNESRQTTGLGPEAALRSLVAAEEWRRLGVLCALLDAHALYAEDDLAPVALAPLYAAYWPQSPLEEVLADLVALGLLVEAPGPRHAVPPEWRASFAATLGPFLDRYPLPVAGGFVSFAELMAGFAAFCAEAQGAPLPPVDLGTFGARAWRLSGRVQALALRPFYLRPRAHAQAFLAVLCPLPPAAARIATGLYTEAPAARARLALYDLAARQKMNVTRGDLFVYLERYLRQAHGLRLTPSQALTDGLMASGILRLEKG